ncbi:MAG: neutral/alkaline non-lysosomal ceramidase N-terminal domain-containing protein [Dehalococcoidales bacterium]|nr:neutral/alkaline non-lysosomal ceramidase N-terminal domain-containing protein [Dehalococcoidales bacterium]
MTRLWLWLWLVPALCAADFQAGLARVRITPEGPIWLSGYASRRHPSTGVVQDLWAKALALEDAKGNRAVIVTTDLIGLPRVVCDEVAARLQKEYELERAELLLNASHTHTGPVVWPNLATMYDLPPGQLRLLRAYSRRLVDAMVTVASAALGKLSPARLHFGQGTAGFAANRRVLTPDGARWLKFGVNPAGPVDHAVPVLKVTDPDGTLRAALFGYACHNTTLTGQHYRISGDYAGFAQSNFEASHPGATALFLQLCGGDQNPNPRGELEHARRHGQELAAAVDRALAGHLIRLHPPIRSAFRMVDLNLAFQSRETYEKELQSPDPARVRRARAVLRALEERRPIWRIPYPVQAIRFNRDLTLLALGGEVVVDYALRARREFARERLVVAGYSNDVMCYIPSRRILREGGYEADQSMVYYGQPGPFTAEVEETIFNTIYQVMRRVGVKRGK